MIFFHNKVIRYKGWTKAVQLNRGERKNARYVEILTVDIYVKVFTVLCHEPFSNPRFLCLVNSLG